MLERLHRWAKDWMTYTLILHAEQDRVIDELVGVTRDI